MEHQNVTLSIPKKILKKAKYLALEKNTSLSAMLTRFIVQMVEKDEAYKRASERHRKVLAQGMELGTEGIMNWQRDELYDH